MVPESVCIADGVNASIHTSPKHQRGSHRMLFGTLLMPRVGVKPDEKGNVKATGESCLSLG